MTPPTLTLHLVRHGETTWNAEGRIQGQIDAPLSARGHAQAASAAAQLSGRAIGAVISSDLSRALNTARAIAEPHELEVRSAPELRERHFGRLQGRLYVEAMAQLGPRWSDLLAGEADIEEAESGRQHFHRVARFLDDLLADPPALEMVLVSHGGTVRRALSYFAQTPGEEDASPILNGSIRTVTVPGSGR